MRQRVAAVVDAVVLAFGTLRSAKRGDMPPFQTSHRPDRRPPTYDTRNEHFVEEDAQWLMTLQKDDHPS